MNEENREVLEAIERIQITLQELVKTVDEIDDVVRGDEGRRLPGLLEDMDLVQQFVLKWDRREYMLRGALILVTSNIFLTVLALIGQFLFS